MLLRQHSQSYWRNETALDAVRIRFQAYPEFLTVPGLECTIAHPAVVQPAAKLYSPRGLGQVPVLIHRAMAPTSFPSNADAKVLQ